VPACEGVPPGPEPPEIDLGDTVVFSLRLGKEDGGTLTNNRRCRAYASAMLSNRYHHLLEPRDNSRGAKVSEVRDSVAIAVKGKARRFIYLLLVIATQRGIDQHTQGTWSLIRENSRVSVIPQVARHPLDIRRSSALDATIAIWEGFRTTTVWGVLRMSSVSLTARLAGHLAIGSLAVPIAPVLGVGIAVRGLALPLDLDHVGVT
jgi:hypothetical protein